ncbi:hypothetical protein AKJ51_05125 [candidate division MSBL1 archaeon SCGC-AAA382A20]|uniref:Uncharacterized protein n=1 Tax=candidate division MSBL1 archaeon SCGC-AAA382A20 TaxID=1698280 RepID=A0A133VFY9_9EURY|nr:hypothetical protein AKJ51_05125 [candidate division MSBL1 archaeon SCGC-AAA382A20]
MFLKSSIFLLRDHSRQLRTGKVRIPDIWEFTSNENGKQEGDEGSNREGKGRGPVASAEPRNEPPTWQVSLLASKRLNSKKRVTSVV